MWGLHIFLSQCVVHILYISVLAGVEEEIQIKGEHLLVAPAFVMDLSLIWQLFKKHLF